MDFVIIALIALIIILLILEIIRENMIFRIINYQIRSPKLSGIKGELKIVFLSDLHNKKYGKENEKLIQAIRDEKPDLILVGGDMVVAKFKTGYAHGLAVLKVLPQICPTYLINGNHEQRLKTYPEKYAPYEPFAKEVMQAGVHILENDNELIYTHGKSIRISGLELPYTYYKENRKQPLSRKVLRSYIGQADGRNFQILLAHNPVHFPVYKAWGADLVLSGHLHGGIVRIPGWRGVISPRGQLFPKYSGELTIEGKSAIVVSRGLGTHTIPIRLCNQGEIVTLTLSASAKTKDSLIKVIKE
ncbi:MAG: metallophosphoesterase [Lachnospiraceae bacterium]|nr:metallophosphoesterase [Lachnospiraceae bacterium]